MPKKGLASLYKEALKSSQAELERRSAMEALRQFDNLDLTLGAFITDLKKDWKTFSQLSLADVLEALAAKGSRRRGRKPGRKPGRSAGAGASAPSKRAPRRLTKAVSAKYTESIKEYLAANPDAKTKTIANEVGLTSKQAASLLKKLRAAKLVTARGKAAGMRYTLKAAAKKPSAPKRPTLRKKSARKKPAKKKAPKRKAAQK